MLKETIALGVFSLLLVTTFTSYSSIITKLHEEEGYQNLGPILLTFSFSSFMIMNSFTPSLPLSYKTQFIIAGICYTMSYVLVVPQLGVNMMYVASIVGVVLGGIGASVFWISQGAYMNLLCTQQQTEERGKYFGILNGFIFANLVLGAIVTTFSLGLFSNQIYYIILSGIGILSLVIGWVFIKDIQSGQFQLETIKDKKSLTCKQTIYGPLTYYPKMKAILLLLVIDGVVMGFTASTILHLIPSTDDKTTDNVRAGILQIFLGVGAIIGAYFSGYLTDKIEVIYVGMSSLVFVVITSVMTFGATFVNEYWSACLCGFFWGLTLYYLQGWMLVICSKIYGGKPEAFAVNKQVHSLSFVVFQIVVIITNDNVNVRYLCLFVIALCIPALFMLRYLPSAPHQQAQGVQGNRHSVFTDEANPPNNNAIATNQ